MSSQTTTAADRRYEPHVRAVPRGTARTTDELPWRGWVLHLEHVGDPQAPVRMLLVHGAGGNAAAMWPFAAHLAGVGAHVTVVDLPGYGRTAPAYRGGVTYQDWQEAVLHVATTLDDDRPLVLVGASMGGMLALDTAARGVGDLVVVTCLLDASRADVRAAIVRVPWLARLTGLLGLAAGPLRRLPLPVRSVAPMGRIANRPGLAAEVLRDRRGGRGSMPLGWFHSFLAAGPAVQPERYAGAPVVLVHPGEDRWTPPEISTSYLQRLPVPTRTVVLEGCGHFPVEEPGFGQLLDTVRAELARLPLRR